MFKFIQSTPASGDCTCGYNIELDKEYTVGEFIKTVLKERSDEWGRFSICEQGRNSLVDTKIQYSYGKITDMDMKDELFNKQIVSVTAGGGWSNMDYTLRIK